MLPQFTQRDIERFWKKVRIGGPDECWPWMSSQHAFGYGQFSFRGARVLYAHRVAYFLETGSDPGPLSVLHSCDNPPCCNPAHLRVGTAVDNSADMMSRGRWNPIPRHHAKGSELPFSKLTESDVRKIRQQRIAGAKLADVAAQFGVSPQTVSGIMNGREWKHVSWPDHDANRRS